MEQHTNLIVPKNHPAYIRLSSITDRILIANEDLPQIARREWTLTVIDSDSKNAFVLPVSSNFLIAIHGRIKNTYYNNS